jgi:alpha-tubulin suppressor-like RCC1 family protein
VHFTRRLLDRRLSGAIVVAGLSTGSVGACSSSEAGSPTRSEPTDAAADVDLDVRADAESIDAAPSAPDAAKPDAAPLPVVCASSSTCATALVTTLGEGFCALLRDGTVACWGQNAEGQLGRGDDAGTADSAAPERVVGLSNIVALDHTCAVDESGGAWCWGTGPYLRDGSPSMTTELTPIKLPISPAKGVGVNRDRSNHVTACALVDTGILCWGSNYYGQVSIPDPAANPFVLLSPQTVTIPNGASIRRLVVGNASFALGDDGTVSSWGGNPGIGRLSSLFPDPYLKTIPLEGVSSLDVDNDKVCAVADGVAYCWGGPIDPNLDDPLGRALPQPLAMDEPVVQIATTVGAYRSSPRGCACGASGKVYCWGPNESGQAGDGTNDFAGAPVEVIGLPGPAAQVKTTPQATCALLTDGTIFCWGDDVYGQLGGGQVKTPSSVAQKVVLP